MRILLFGKYGQLGWELRRTLATLGQVISFDYPEVDFAQPDDLKTTILEYTPNVIVNAVAYTDVDRAEQEPEKCTLINTAAPGVLAEAARNVGAAIVHFSTDYVFDGQKTSPYVELDPPNPAGVYAKSKLSGEQAIQQYDGSYLILRTSWMYSLRRDNYVKKVLGWARNHPVLRIVTDQLGSPTSARMLAELTAQTLALGRQDIQAWLKEHGGIYHLAGDGVASRFEFAQEVLRYDPQPQEQILVDIQPAKLSDFPSLAPRPANSSLDCTKFSSTFGLQLPPWQEALRLTLEAS